MTIIGWRRFAVERLTQTPVKYKFSESLKILVYEGIFIKIKKKKICQIYCSIIFPKYRGSLMKFGSGRIEREDAINISMSA